MSKTEEEKVTKAQERNGGAAAGEGGGHRAEKVEDMIRGIAPRGEAMAVVGWFRGGGCLHFHLGGEGES